MRGGFHWRRYVAAASFASVNGRIPSTSLGRSWGRPTDRFSVQSLSTSSRLQRPERVPAMCFLDLTGYTRLTEERGDIDAADLARSLSSLVQQHSARSGGTAVKWLGDGVRPHRLHVGPVFSGA
jgi:class 3 adenylate cyclase